MNPALAAFAALPGLAIGSFLNVVAARVPKRRSIVTPGSTCPSCETPIAWYDNVPLVSYLFLRGRCRSCGARIGWTYPAVELLTALLIVGCLLAFGLTPRAAVGSFFCAVLVAISVIDIEHRIIPNRIVVPAAAVVLAAQTVIDPSPEWAIAAFGAAGFLLVTALIYPAGMGMGDVKLALLMGAALGRSVTAALMLAMVVAMVPSIVILVRHGKAGRKMGIPFGPFLAIGSVTALFAGEAILDAYLRLY